MSGCWSIRQPVMNHHCTRLDFEERIRNKGSRRTITAFDMFPTRLQEEEAAAVEVRHFGNCGGWRLGVGEVAVAETDRMCTRLVVLHRSRESESSAVVERTQLVAAASLSVCVIVHCLSEEAVGEAGQALQKHGDRMHLDCTSFAVAVGAGAARAAGEMVCVALATHPLVAALGYSYSPAGANPEAGLAVYRRLVEVVRGGN